MELVEKLNLLNFSEKEKNKLDRFSATLYLIDDMEEKLAFLGDNGVTITHARELKVLCITQERLTESFRVIGELEETQMFVEDPLRLCINPIDIYRKIKYCKANNIPYRNEDGSYMDFLFSEKAWNKELTNSKGPKSGDRVDISEDFVTVEPVMEDPVLSFPSIGTPKASALEDDITSIADFTNNQVDNNSIPTSMYDAPIVESETEDMESDLAIRSEKIKEARKALEAQLSALDEIRSSELVSFDDIQPESFEQTVGGR